MKPGRPPHNALALVLSVIPGFGHLYLDAYLLGTLLFAGFVTGLNALFLGATLQTVDHPEALRQGGAFVLGITWVASVVHAYKLSYGTDRVELAQRRRETLRQGLVHYLRDELNESSQWLERAYKLDVDWSDPDPAFHLGVVWLRLAERRASKGRNGPARQARRRALNAFRACASRDPQGKWTEAIQAESERLHTTVSMLGFSRVSRPSELLSRLDQLALQTVTKPTAFNRPPRVDSRIIRVPVDPDAEDAGPQESGPQEPGPQEPGPQESGFQESGPQESGDEPASGTA